MRKVLLLVMGWTLLTGSVMSALADAALPAQGLENYWVLVDANDGRLLWRKNITNDQTQSVTYSVLPLTLHASRFIASSHQRHSCSALHFRHVEKRLVSQRFSAIR